MKGKFDPYVLLPLAWDLWPLNSRPVYCSRLYGICKISVEFSLDEIRWSICCLRICCWHHGIQLKLRKKITIVMYKLSILFLLLKSRWDKKVPLTASTARDYIEDFAHIFGKLTTHICDVWTNSKYPDRCTSFWEGKNL